MEEVTIQCPHCWEQIQIFVDPSVPVQEYIEDCPVCCSPNLIHVDVSDEDDPRVWAQREQD